MVEGLSVIEFAVYGEPKPQGSTRVVPIRAKGGGYLTREDGRPVLRPIHQRDGEVRAWRQAVADEARRAMDAAGVEGLVRGPIALTVRLFRPRPAGHFGTGRNSGVVKASAPPYPGKRPDTIKLVRAIEDALTGVVWQDDAQLVRHDLAKDWGAMYVTFVTIERMPDAPPISGK